MQFKQKNGESPRPMIHMGLFGSVVEIWIKKFIVIHKPGGQFYIRNALRIWPGKSVPRMHKKSKFNQLGLGRTNISEHQQHHWTNKRKINRANSKLLEKAVSSNPELQGRNGCLTRCDSFLCSTLLSTHRREGYTRSSAEYPCGRHHSAQPVGPPLTAELLPAEARD